MYSHVELCQQDHQSFQRAQEEPISAVNDRKPHLPNTWRPKKNFFSSSSSTKKPHVNMQAAITNNFSMPVRFTQTKKACPILLSSFACPCLSVEQCVEENWRTGEQTFFTKEIRETSSAVAPAAHRRHLSSPNPVSSNRKLWCGSLKKEHNENIRKTSKIHLG